MPSKQKLSPIWSLTAILTAACLLVSLLSIFPSEHPFFKHIHFLSALEYPDTTNAHLKNQKDSISLLIKEHALQSEAFLEKDGRLNAFFEAIQLMQDSGGHVHVAYFGDSMIEGDLLTAAFRKKMQSLFGGAGVGFVPITSPVAGFRNTIRHEFNHLWNENNFAQKDANSSLLYGPSGHRFGAQPMAEVKYQATHFPFARTQLIFQPGLTGKFELLIDQDTPLTIDLSAEMQHPVLTLTNQKHKSIYLRCTEGQPVLYGMNFEKGSGCYIDNFAFRGSTGTSLSLLDKNFMQKINDSLNYKLLIMQYGLNVIGEGVTDYSNYQKSMERTLVHLQKCFPDAAILLVGMTDKGTNIEGKWVADPAVPFLLNHQIKMAERQSLPFFSLYNAMGGEGSMLAWVNDSTPSLANKDYTHPNFKGANLLADSLFAYIKRSYDWFIQHPPASKKKKDEN
jgi:lysophospholipase L1-like esterase